MTLDKGARDGERRWHLPASRNGNGKGTQLARLMRQVGHGLGTPGSWSRRWHLSHQPASRSSNGKGAQLGRLMAREVGHGPGTPGSWSRFLVAHIRWILGVTLAVVAAAAVFALTQTQLYASGADVVVEPAPAVGGGSAQQPDMTTEASVVTSGAVLSKASQAIHVPVAALSNGLSVTAKGASFVLHITYSAADPHIAQQRAQAIAQAYTSFRSANPAPNGTAPNTAPVATLITPASLPTSPYSPNYPLDLGIALLVGLALAIVTAWGRDYLDDRPRGPLDLEQQAGADVLGMIPAFHPGGPELAGRLVMAVSPDSIVAEAYRSLRTRVLLTLGGRDSGTILVTSPAWEDRGTVAANLAAALAQSGRSTILVCADLRWGSAHLITGTRNDAGGLTGLLERRTDVASALHATSVPGLRLLPPGELPLDAAALLQRPAVETVLNEIRSQADVVVIEAPPMLVTPDARPLADCADIILLIADARASTRAQVRAAVRELEPERARLAGCVLVNVGRRRQVRSEYPPSAHAVDDRPRGGPASSGDVTAPLPATRPGPPGGGDPFGQQGQEAAWADREHMAGHSAAPRGQRPDG